MTWKRWLQRARITDDPAGDLIADARKDRRMPEIHSQVALQSYLINRDACSEALDTIPEVWRRCQQWCKQA